MCDSYELLNELLNSTKKIVAFIACPSCVSCSQKTTTMCKMVLANPTAMCEIETIRLKNIGARIYRQGEVHVKSVCIAELPIVRCVCITRTHKLWILGV